MKTKLMVSGSEGELFRSKIDPCGLCGRRVMSNSLLRTKCGNWVHGRCAKIRRVTTRLAMCYVCFKCRGVKAKNSDSIEKLCDEVENVNGFCYLGDRLNAGGGCEAAVTARVRIGWMRFRECGELLLGNRFPLKMKGKVYRCCVRSAVLYGSETWCLREHEKAILRRAERAMLRAMCGRKATDKPTSELMDMLRLKETVDGLATTFDLEHPQSSDQPWLSLLRLAFSRFSLVALAFSCHSLLDLRQLVKHYHYPFSVRVHTI